MGSRLFCDAAREYLEAQADVFPSHEELAVQLAEVNRLNRSAGKAEVTKKQLNRYWQMIRVFGPSVKESTAAAEEHTSLQTKMRGVTLAVHQHTRFGYVGVTQAWTSKGYRASFPARFRALTNAGYKTFNGSTPVVCAYARALASKIVDGDVSAWKPLKELYSEHYSLSTRGRWFLRQKGIPLAAEDKQFEPKQSASKKPAAAERAPKRIALQKRKAMVHESQSSPAGKRRKR